MTPEETRVYFGPRIQSIDGTDYDYRTTGVGITFQCVICRSNNDSYPQARKCFESHGEANGRV